MRVLVLNAGSSTLKIDVLRDDLVEAHTVIDPWDGTPDSVDLSAVLAGGLPIDAVAHRVVHGGRHATGPAVIDDTVARAIADHASLAPLHQHRALAAITLARRALPDLPHIACFDTAFHATMSAAARTYALPSAWRRRWGLQRIGFHGLSHAWAARRGPTIADGTRLRRIVTCHLGSGASACAVVDGRSVDTTMGWTPLDGLVMATRSGSVDPGVVLWLIAEAGLSPAEVRDGLTDHAGLAGLADLADLATGEAVPGTAGRSGDDGRRAGDMRALLAARAAGDEDAELAVDVYVHRLRQGIAAMATSAGGMDLLVFTGGVGEHAPEIRSATVAGLGLLGVTIDEDRNRAATGDAHLTPPGATVRTAVVTAREDIEMARQVRDLLTEGTRRVSDGPVLVSRPTG